MSESEFRVETTLGRSVRVTMLPDIASCLAIVLLREGSRTEDAGWSLAAQQLEAAARAAAGEGEG